MKIVFADTNVIYGLFLKIIAGEIISHSAIFSLAKKNQVYISAYILKELKKNIYENKGYILTDTSIQYFFDISGLLLIPGQGLRQSYITMVADIADEQILQDAIDVNADYILTQNIRDFYVDRIQQEFSIKVINSIPQELLI